jgi:hypothetical protein
MGMMAWDEHRIICCHSNCKAQFVLPNALFVSAKACEKIMFYCPYGHVQHFSSPADVAREEQLRRERDLLKQRIAEKDDEIIAERNGRLQAERNTAAQRGQVTRLKNRAKAGMCPCCNRHFINLERHMASKHADEKAEA